MPEPRLSREADALAAVQQLIAEHKAGRMRVLEAGCGSLPREIDLGDNVHLVGIDISEEQLRRNDALDEKVLGDLQTHAFRPGEFDLVVAWNVLEHLPHPELALDNFRRSTSAGGLMVLKVPNPVSAKGLVTKFTPHAFHVWVYRRLLHYPNAGKEGHTPFRTFMRWSIAPHRLADYARRHGLVIEYLATYEADRQTALRSRLHLTGRPWRALARVARRVSGSRLDLEGTELVAVLRNGPFPEGEGA